MADITNLFKATVKTLKSRSKALTKDKHHVDKTDIFPSTKQKGEFESTCKDVVATITKLKDFLLEHRKDYVNAGSHLSGESSRMTDTEREHIDNEAQNILRKCQDTLATVKKNGETEKVHPQVKEHREAVQVLITAYLKVVTKIYSEQRAVRVKRVVDKKRISRIEPEKRRLSHQLSKQQSVDNDSGDVNQSSNGTPEPSAPAGTNRAAGKGATSSGASESTPKRKRVEGPLVETDSYADSDEELSPEEAQMFEEENKAMYEEMNSLSEEVSKITGKVVEIASLQEIFAEKVLTQEEDIQRIADTAVFTTENIVAGNEEIREAMKKNAGFRVWILFFLLVLTFSLLFLDWYSG